MPRAPVLLVLMVFLAELPPLLQRAPAHSPVTMDTLKADREKRETPEEAKRPWDGLYLTDHTLWRDVSRQEKTKRQPSNKKKASWLWFRPWVRFGVGPPGRPSGAVGSCALLPPRARAACKAS